MNFVVFIDGVVLTNVFLNHYMPSDHRLVTVS
jgi:hypothetical protein